MDRIERLQVLLRVAEAGSFTAAAESLGLPRASVSLAVQQLEAQLHTRLLHRTTRSVRLTPDGEAMLARARQLVADMAELQEQFEHQPAALQGTLKVDLPSRIARRLVVPALPAFLGQHPNLHLELGATDRAIDLVQEGIDCALRVGTLGSSGSLVARPLGQFRLGTWASPGYLAQYGTPADVAALAGHRLITYAPPGAPRPAPVLELALPPGAAPPPALPHQLDVNHVETYIAGALAGLGLIQVPAYDVQHLVAAGQLVEVLPQLAPAPLPVHLVYPHRRHLARRVQRFGDWLAELLAPHLVHQDGS